MASRKLTDKLIDRSKIKEELGKIEESDVDFVTRNGNVYCYYGNDKFLKKTVFPNKHNGYYYVSIKSKEGKQIQRRIHILVAKAFIEKNDPTYNVVMHKDNDKSNNNVNNLMWGNTSINTKQAFDDGLIVNDKGFDDSQSMAVVQFDGDSRKIMNVYGSVSIASKKIGLTKGCILYQTKHKTKNITKKPRCGYYFRFLDEYLKNGFVL